MLDVRNGMKHFSFWCQKVLPLVYDDSLSYYEVLCKVVTYINKLIDEDKLIEDNIEELQNELNTVQDWIDNYDTSFAEKIISDHLATMIFVEITDNGYIMFNIPDSWHDIQFATTGLDITIPNYDYGHLVLLY